ncbi:MAG TPA: pyridoxamine 5'-phosphate oxidase family protein [Microthrixaceae bacterium]|nr:pyridoxamine 5'-phosphate oxidase family protein [Microthrixaceae bacterium]
MTVSDPVTEAMSRAGKGTEATTDAGNNQPLPWSEATARFSQGGWFWLATVRPDGSPHVMPILAAWADPVLYVVSKDSARKSRNLAAENRCVLTKDAGDLHLVIESHARRLEDRDELIRASSAFERVYGWSTSVAGDQLDAEFGAPTSGGPPYAVFEITPITAFGFPTDGETTTPTRWRFDD